MVHITGVALIVIRAGAITLVLTLGPRLPRDQLPTCKYGLLFFLFFFFLSLLGTYASPIIQSY